jgi:hypothetical protein
MSGFTAGIFLPINMTDFWRMRVLLLRPKMIMSYGVKPTGTGNSDCTETWEGAGVRLHRAFGYHEIPRFDPFLMLEISEGIIRLIM